jgi:hypothetical protein
MTHDDPLGGYPQRVVDEALSFDDNIDPRLRFVHERPKAIEKGLRPSTQDRYRPESEVRHIRD